MNFGLETTKYDKKKYGQARKILLPQSGRMTKYLLI